MSVSALRQKHIKGKAGPAWCIGIPSRGYGGRREGDVQDQREAVIEAIEQGATTEDLMRNHGGYYQKHVKYVDKMLEVLPKDRD